MKIPLLGETPEVPPFTRDHRAAPSTKKVKFLQIHELSSRYFVAWNVENDSWAPKKQFLGHFGYFRANHNRTRMESPKAYKYPGLRLQKRGASLYSFTNTYNQPEFSADNWRRTEKRCGVAG